MQSVTVRPALRFYIANQLPGLLVESRSPASEFTSHWLSDKRKAGRAALSRSTWPVSIYMAALWIYSQESSGRQSDLRPGVRFNRVQMANGDLLRQVDKSARTPRDPARYV